jgi:hypothetical protein
MACGAAELLGVAKKGRVDPWPEKAHSSSEGRNRLKAVSEKYPGGTYHRIGPSATKFLFTWEIHLITEVHFPLAIKALHL